MLCDTSGMMAMNQDLATGCHPPGVQPVQKAFTETSADIDKTKAFTSKAGDGSSAAMIKARP